ncbi:cysteine-rich receptor-like protein kinase 42 [Malania oleifera]|uniref:cysteine-rich receptor-like protein kinase 42 n=1 Tax=Malania oleifera TaxID=397392 RepID=UPI0025AEB642|nr:cysteine-rich receptor-like protein kinase 42 [Malania oleifera]
MRFSALIHRILAWVVVFSSIFFVSHSLPENRTAEARLFCGKSQFPAAFADNLKEMMEVLSLQISLQHWGTASIVSNPQMFGLAQCHEDLSAQDCQLCFVKSRNKLPRCLPSNSARMYLDGCFLRYDNYSFFSESVDRVHDFVRCEEDLGFVDRITRGKFNNSVDEALENVTKKAVQSGGFAVAEARHDNSAPAYALAQCWNSVSVEDCEYCFGNATAGLMTCLPRLGGKAMYAGCYLRYSSSKFFDDDYQSDTAPPPVGIFVVVVVVVILSMIIVCGVYLHRTKLSKARTEPKNHIPGPTEVINPKVNFPYEVLEKATEFFDASRKLGQGAAGSVYKGTLPDGTIVAVKRLHHSIRQWTDHFFNEVHLVERIRHKNLVRLLGMSIEGAEMLLVYEYVPNKGLDQFLFDRNMNPFLNWQQRFHIILGIAEGLAHLHGGSAKKIIHRDIKCSNILLDENLTPKIADFGLACCVASNRPCVLSHVAGTLGYMAPEYLLRGLLTDKADVYAFGVLVLEIATGRKNSIYMQGTGSILETVWKDYRSDHVAQSVDPCLKGDFPVQQASNVLQIGLLCTQAPIALRPSMSEIVEMLVNEGCQIPPPQEAPFLNASVLFMDDGSKSSFMMALSKHSTAEVQSTHTDKSSLEE